MAKPKPPTKVEIANYYGITTVTLNNYEKEAKKGNKEYERRLNAFYDYYQRHVLMSKQGVRILTDNEDGQTYYLYKE